MERNRRTKKEILANVPKPFTSAKIIAPNTLRIEYTDKTTAIRLHDTDIATILPNGNYILTSGGWLTSTTKERLNRFTPFRIYQSKGAWFLSNGVLFFDGIELDANGAVIGEKREYNEKEINAVKRC